MSFHSFARMLILPFTLSLMTAAGCVEPPPDALKQVAEAERDFRNQNYPSAEEKLSRYLKQYPNSSKSAEAYYLRALCSTKRSNRVMAEADARQCIKLSKDASLTSNAHATIATLLFESNRTEESLDHFERALKSMPDKPPADLLRYRYATSLQREGKWPDAKAQYTELARRFPSSDLAMSARRALEWPHDAFTIQCGAFRDRAGAAALEKQLKSSGHKAWIEQRSRSGEVLYNVYVDRFGRYAAAREALPRVQRVAAGAHIVP